MIGTEVCKMIMIKVYIIIIMNKNIMIIIKI